MKFNDVIHQALIEHTKDRKESTVYKLKKTAIFIPNDLLEKNIDCVSFDIINSFFNNLYYKGYSYNYINSFYSLFSVTFKYAITHELITMNPFLRIRKFKKTEYTQKSTNYLNIEQFNKLLELFKIFYLQILYKVLILDWLQKR